MLTGDTVSVILVTQHGITEQQHTNKMRTKTLLIAAAALVAATVSSEAQVYSANVVGYVNQVCPANALVLSANPLDDGTNTLNSLLAAMPAKSTAQIWNGSSFTLITKPSAGATWPAQTVPPGTGFFVKSPSLFTNTYVGSVACLVGSNVTNTLNANILYLVGSTVAYSANFNDTNNTLNLSVLPAKSTAQIWNGSGFTLLTKSGAGPTWPAGNTNTVAGGFFIKSPSTFNWVQTLH